MPVNNITGSPVEGDDFFGRENELSYAWDHIRKGNSFLLAAPRRVGKSSFAKKLIAIAKSDGWHTLELNLEEVKTEEEFIRLFVKKLYAESWWHRIKDKSGEGVKKILESLNLTTTTEGTTVALKFQFDNPEINHKLTKLLDHHENTLIMVDELTILLYLLVERDPEKGIQKAQDVLNWLRSIRQVTGTKIRWVFCSSVGIENFCNQYNLSYTTNDLSPLELAAFSENQSQRFIQALASAESIQLENDQVEHMLRKLGWLLPYFIQILFFELHKLHVIHDCELSIETIDEAYLKLTSEKHLNTWEERLSAYGDLERSAKVILTSLCSCSEGESR
ncbi:MAG TPA: hypothetical protein PKG48_05135 [Bacteroidales bacterium]|nr:hypothetical protein [Bacteroidales bacterium]HPS62651.1 hypothetical protein [Bacteroidales bacterium]